MSQRWVLTTGGQWIQLIGSDLPNLDGIPGFLDILQLKRRGINGQSIFMRDGIPQWRFPNLIEGTNAHIILPYAIGSGAGLFEITVPNEVYCIKVNLPYSIPITKIICSILTAQAASHVGVGLYALDGSRTINGTVDSSSTGAKTITLNTTIFQPGAYWLGFTGDVAGVQIVAAEIDGLFGEIMNEGTFHIAVSNQVSAAGVLPATFGTLSETLVNCPIVKLQG